MRSVLAHPMLRIRIAALQPSNNDIMDHEPLLYNTPYSILLTKTFLIIIALMTAFYQAFALVLDLHYGVI